MAKFCWEMRGCEGPENNYDHCPHYMKGAICPKDCQFSWCHRATHKFPDDPLMLLDPDVDHLAAIKEYCFTCEFFLKNGPRSTEAKAEDEAAHLGDFMFGIRPELVNDEAHKAGLI
jgi:hypothetical protein